LVAQERRKDGFWEAKNGFSGSKGALSDQKTGKIRGLGLPISKQAKISND
jgi:hypothetical protein